MDPVVERFFGEVSVRPGWSVLIDADAQYWVRVSVTNENGEQASASGPSLVAAVSATMVVIRHWLQ